jgi:hypothetical protein
VAWKALHCTASDKGKVKVNDKSHSRGTLPCACVRRPKLTKAIKAYIAQEAESLHPTRVILVNIKKQSSIPTPRRGYPEPMQVQNALKRIRREEGTKNSIVAIQAFVRARVFDIAHDPLSSSDQSLTPMATRTSAQVMTTTRSSSVPRL